jgi:DNA-binding transcriptional MocR family regulator
VIEDDIYGDLHFGPQRPWPIKAFDTAGNVMLCSSFSKSLSPSLRIGFVAAGRYRSAIALQKTITSGGTNPITQNVLAEYLASTAFERHLRRCAAATSSRSRPCRRRSAGYFPAATRISQPQGGYVLWVELPEEFDTSQIYERVIAENLAYVPGELFSASGMYRNCLRLNCGNPHTPEIDDAVRRLGRIIDAA